MSTPSPFAAAAAVPLVQILTAVQTLITNMGTDPLQIAAKFPGALAIFLGTVEMQLPVLAASEIGAVQAQANAKIAGWITSLQAQAAPKTGAPV